MGIVWDRLVEWLAEDADKLIGTEKPKRVVRPRPEKSNCPICGADLSLKEAKVKFCSRRCAGIATAQKKWREKMEEGK